MPLADERQRLVLVEVLGSCGEVGAAVLEVLGGLAQVHIDSADSPGQVLESREGDLHEVVDLHPGERADGLDQPLLTSVLLLLLGPGGVHRGVPVGVRRIDLRLFAGR